MSIPPSLYPWQQQAWKDMQSLQGRWPHALLLHGPAGIGKTVFAEWLAQSLLCESPKADGQACNACAACTWYVQGNHPDYRRLRPGSIDAEDVEQDSKKNESKSTKTPSKEIVIDQVRQLSDFLSISTHRQGRRVIVIYPADAMNNAAANALLKSLEEPGPNTIFILVTHSTDALLPTLVSRCHQCAFSMPDVHHALDWLSEQGISNPAPQLAEQGGAPLAALAAAQSDADVQAAQYEFFEYLHSPTTAGALKVAEKVHKLPITLLTSWMQRWLYDVLSCKLVGKIRYYPHYQQHIERAATAMSLPTLLKRWEANIERKAVAEHPLSPKLVVEAMLLGS